ncbi:MAG: capping complex subunit for YIEGIA [Peptococcaceae bacterium]
MQDTILAVVVTRRHADKVQGMNSIFIVEDEAELERTALLLSRILKAMAHDLENGVTILVQH